MLLKILATTAQKVKVVLENMCKFKRYDDQKTEQNASMCMCTTSACTHAGIADMEQSLCVWTYVYLSVYR